MSVCKPEVIGFARDDYTESDHFPATEILEGAPARLRLVRRASNISSPGYKHNSWTVLKLLWISAGILDDLIFHVIGLPCEITYIFQKRVIGSKVGVKNQSEGIDRRNG
jgi:hypothetical protein